MVADVRMLNFFISIYICILYLFERGKHHPFVLEMNTFLYRELCKDVDPQLTRYLNGWKETEKYTEDSLTNSQR